MPECVNKQIGGQLHAYELKLLDQTETEQFEIHILQCDHCLHQVREFKEYADALREGELVQRTVRDVAEQKQTEAVGDSIRGLLQGIPFATKACAVSVLIILLLLPLYLVTRQSPGETVRPLQMVTFSSVRSAGVTIDLKNDLLLSFVFDDARPGHVYNVSIIENGGSAVYENKSFTDFNDSDMGCLMVPANLLKKGKYRLIIVDPTGDPLSNKQEYSFTIDLTD